MFWNHWMKGSVKVQSIVVILGSHTCRVQTLCAKGSLVVFLHPAFKEELTWASDRFSWES